MVSTMWGIRKKKTKKELRALVGTGLLLRWPFSTEWSHSNDNSNIFRELCVWSCSCGDRLRKGYTDTFVTQVCPRPTHVKKRRKKGRSVCAVRVHTGEIYKHPMMIALTCFTTSHPRASLVCNRTGVFVTQAITPRGGPCSQLTWYRFVITVASFIGDLWYERKYKLSQSKTPVFAAAAASSAAAAAAVSLCCSWTWRNLLLRQMTTDGGHIHGQLSRSSSPPLLLLCLLWFFGGFVYYSFGRDTKRET